jgi:hypothetical protein
VCICEKWRLSVPPQAKYTLLIHQFFIVCNGSECDIAQDNPKIQLLERQTVMHGRIAHQPLNKACQW